MLVKETEEIPLVEQEPTVAQATPLHHIAFEISLKDYRSEKERLEKLGLQVTTTTHAWGHLRSIYLQDPEQIS